MGDERSAAIDKQELGDEALMVAYVGGDQEAFRELFRRYTPLLLHLGGAEGSDLVQQTFLQLHRARHDYRPGLPLRPWLLTIAYNLRRDRWRRRRPATSLAEVPEPATALTPAGMLEREREAARLRAALAELPDHQRQVIELHWFAGLPFAEVARAVGASEGAAKILAHRGYQRLRRILGAADRAPEKK